MEGSGAALEPERYTALPEMFEAADVVVLATITGVTERFPEGWDDLIANGYRLIALEVDVADVVRRGHGDIPQEFPIHLTSKASLDEISQTVVGTRAYFYLRHISEEVVLADSEGNRVETPFFRLVSSQGLIADNRGDAVFPLGEIDDNIMVRDHTDKPFDSILP